MVSFAFAALALAAVSATSAAPHAHGDHEHVGRGLGLGAWYQERADTAELFRRAPGDGPRPGSPQWLAQYPPAGGVPSQAEKDIPAAWLAAYRAAKAAGKIPNIPVSQLQPAGFPSYGALSATGPEVCSSTPKCRAADDIWDAPANTIGISFDDGPWQGTNKLLDFLERVNQTATHYCIGRNIAQHPQEFLRAFNLGGEMAVHTWSHPLMTNQTDYGVLVELGWTMQIIYDLTGGRVPKYWRPPQGDADNRVRAIAKEVFGMTVVFWNQDTEDWSLSTPNPVYSAQETTDLLNKWLSGPKNPGLVILEHELTDDTVGIFMNTTWPGIQAHNWQPKSIAQMLNLPFYQNARDSKSPVTPQAEVVVSVPAGGGGQVPTSSNPPPTNTPPPTRSSGPTSPTSSDSTPAPTESGSEEPDNSAGRASASALAVLSAALAVLLL